MWTGIRVTMAAVAVVATALAGCSPQALGTPVIRDQVFIGTAIPMDAGTVPPRMLLASGD